MCVCINDKSAWHTFASTNRLPWYFSGWLLKASSLPRIFFILSQQQGDESCSVYTLINAIEWKLWRQRTNKKYKNRLDVVSHFRRGKNKRINNLWMFRIGICINQTKIKNKNKTKPHIRLFPTHLVCGLNFIRFHYLMRMLINSLCVCHGIYGILSVVGWVAIEWKISFYNHFLTVYWIHTHVTHKYIKRIMKMTFLTCHCNVHHTNKKYVIE